MGAERVVPAAEFTRNFGRYQTLAQQEAVAVSSRGRITGYVIAAAEYAAFKRFKGSRRSFAAVNLTEEAASAITASPMDAGHDHLNALLDAG